MLSVLSIAAGGMATQAERVEAVAQNVASEGTTAAPEGAQETSRRVRIGALPVGSTIEESMVTLVEAENAYRANAVMLATADAVLGALLDTLDSD